MIKCSECGYENMDGLDYCDGCGAKLESAPPHNGDASPPAHTGAPAAASEPASASEVTAVETPPAATTETGAAAPASAPSAIPAESGTSNEHSAEVAEPPSAKAP